MILGISLRTLRILPNCNNTLIWIFPFFFLYFQFFYILQGSSKYSYNDGYNNHLNISKTCLVFLSWFNYLLSISLAFNSTIIYWKSSNHYKKRFSFFFLLIMIRTFILLIWIERVIFLNLLRILLFSQTAFIFMPRKFSLLFMNSYIKIK